LHPHRPRPISTSCCEELSVATQQTARLL
jgi:hypothetical protein